MVAFCAVRQSLLLTLNSNAGCAAWRFNPHLVDWHIALGRDRPLDRLARQQQLQSCLKGAKGSQDCTGLQ